MDPLPSPTAEHPCSASPWVTGLIRNVTDEVLDPRAGSQDGTAVVRRAIPWC
jgi:hypothetical protein